MDKNLKMAGEAAYHLGLLAECDIELIKAREWYKKTLKLDPGHEKARLALEKIQKQLGSMRP